MNTKNLIGISLVAIAGAVLMTGCDQPSRSTLRSTQADAAADQLLERCISQARANGYRSGQCAYNFINACVTTQSRDEMESWLRADQSSKIGSKYCPNSPDTYNTAFDKF